MDESRARALLRAERAEVATLLRDTEAAVSIEEQAPDIATDYGDESLPLTEGANDEAVAVQLRDRLGAIDRALARLEAGTYGRSVLSGKPIPDQRLEADPAAELTVEEARASRLPPGQPEARTRSVIHAAICARFLKPSFAMMLATCLATVAGLITSSAAMALLLRPLAISTAISRSRAVSTPCGAGAVVAPGASPRRGARRAWSIARSIAASGDRASPRDQSSAAAPSSSWRTAAR
jgi:RNA polymerase-binding transcription factor